MLNEGHPRPRARPSCLDTARCSSYLNSQHCQFCLSLNLKSFKSFTFFLSQLYLGIEERYEYEALANITPHVRRKASEQKQTSGIATLGSSQRTEPCSPGIRRTNNHNSFVGFPSLSQIGRLPGYRLKRFAASQDPQRHQGPPRPPSEPFSLLPF